MRFCFEKKNLLQIYCHHHNHHRDIELHALVCNANAYYIATEKKN
jgi:hypothetical protein